MKGNKRFSKKIDIYMLDKDIVLKISDEIMSELDEELIFDKDSEFRDDLYD